MTFALFNRVHVETASAGTGDLTLGVAVSSAHQSFAAAGVPNGAIFPYTAYTATQFECGIGSYISAGPTLDRTASAVSAGSAGAGVLVNFAVNPRVFIGPLADIHVQRSGDTMTGQLLLAYTSPIIALRKGASGEAAVILSQTGAFSRWQLQLGNGDGEAGSNSGSNFALVRRQDDGTAFPSLGTVLNFNRATGLGVVAADPTAALGIVTKQYADAITTALNSGLATKEPTITAGTTAQYWRGDKSFQTLDKAAVGLSNVDNTSDANKPVSTAQNTADLLRVLKAGDTLTGTLINSTTATAAVNASTTTASPQFSSRIQARASGAVATCGIEFGHTSAGWGSTLGCFIGTGPPFLAFCTGPGTTNDTFRTFGRAGSVMRGDALGGFIFGTVANSSADNQSMTNLATLTTAGVLSLLANIGSTSATTGTLVVTGGVGVTGALVVSPPASISAVVANSNGLGAVRAAGTPGVGSALQLIHVRPIATQKGYITFTEDTIANRWAIGIEGGNGDLFVRAGQETDIARLRLTNGGIFTFNANGATVPATPSLTNLHVIAADAAAAGQVFIDTFAGEAGFTGRRANNTAASPSALALDNFIASFNASGFGTAYTGTRGAIAFLAAEAWTGTAQGTKFRLFTTPLGTTGAVSQVEIGPDGLVTLTRGQIKFPATQVPSSDVNTLDDYEESNSFTPALSFTTPGTLSVTYSVQTGSYTKIGRKVTATVTIVTSSFTLGTASGNLLVTGLPFASQNVANIFYFAALSWSGITKTNYTDIVARLDPNTTTVVFRASGSAQGAAFVTSTDTPTGGPVILAFTLVYFTA